MFNYAEEYINCCNTITDDEVLEALDALMVARSLFEYKNATIIPERINICLNNGNIVYSIRNENGTNNTYTCMSNPWYYSSNLYLGVLTVVAISLIIKFI